MVSIDTKNKTKARTGQPWRKKWPFKLFYKPTLEDKKLEILNMDFDSIKKDVRESRRDVEESITEAFNFLCDIIDRAGFNSFTFNFREFPLGDVAVEYSINVNEKTLQVGYRKIINEGKIVSYDKGFSFLKHFNGNLLLALKKEIQESRARAQNKTVEAKETKNKVDFMKRLQNLKVEI
jgi:hypothetical protein